MRPEHHTTTAPTSLISTLEAHLEGTAHIDLEHKRGRSGYQPTGLRWGVDPDDDPHEVAHQILDEATGHFHNEGGGREKGYRILLSGEKVDEKAEFSVDPNAPTRSEDQARSSFIHTMTFHFGQVYRENLYGMRAQREMVEAVTKVIPGLISLRLDAIDDRAEAMLEGLGRRPSSSDDNGWDGAVDTVKEAIRTFGPAMAAKAFDLSPEQTEALMRGQVPADGESAGDDSVRGLLVKLGSSLSNAQKTEMVKTVGLPYVNEIGAITKLKDEAEARRRTAKLLDAMDKSDKADALMRVLDEEQQAILSSVMDLAEKAD